MLSMRVAPAPSPVSDSCTVRQNNGLVVGQKDGLAVRGEDGPAVPREAVPAVRLEDGAAVSREDGPAVRSVLRLARRLRLLTAVARPSRCSVVAAVMLYVLLTLCSLLNVTIMANVGKTLLRLSFHWIYAAVTSHLFGVLEVVQWVSLTVTFAVGRRRYAPLLERLRELAEEKDLLDECLGRRKWTDRSTWLSWILFITWSLATAAVVFTNRQVRNSCRFSPVSCTLQLVLAVLSSFAHLVFFNTVLKFVSICLLLEQCLDTLNAGLRRELSPAGGSGTRRLGLLQLARYQRLLSACLRQLTSASCAELVLVTLYGVLSLVCLIIAAEFLLTQSMLVVPVLVSLVAQTSAAALCLLGPCEASQRLLSRLTSSGDLLLLLLPRCRHWQQSRHEADVMLLVAGRDLEATGDLGLFRLRRSTLLGLVSTVITYLVIMLQFLMSVDVRHLVATPGRNETE